MNTGFYVPLLTFLSAYLWFIDYNDKDFWLISCFFLIGGFILI